MKADGYDVTGIMLKLWKGAAANNESGCCSLDAAEDARRVAQVLDIPFYVFNFADYFSETVIQRFVDGYAGGLTPNPCVECNRSIKFSVLLERAKAFDAQRLVTGHYARNESGDGKHRLLRGEDPQKDQSYVLYMLGQEELAQVEFPVGRYAKPEIRKIAASLGLRTAFKPESQEICFVPNGDVHSFISSAVPEGSVEGPVVSSEGERLGTHRGVAHYTLGQRRGLGIAVGTPVFVTAIRPGENTIVVDRNPARVTDLYLDDVSFTAGDAPDSLRASVMTRYRGPEAMASMVRDGNCWRVSFDEPQPPAAPGQAAVFYAGEQVLGGGTIGGGFGGSSSSLTGPGPARQ
jgi:tRNA-specific 2-thiouridylase